MKCVEVIQNLAVLFDGEANGSEANDLRSHIESCGSCRKELMDQHSISANLKRLRPVSAPASLDEKVMRAFSSFHDRKKIPLAADEKRTETNGWFGIPRFAYAAALVLCALTAISAFQIGERWGRENRSGEPQITETINFPAADENQTVKIVEVPVVQEKIVRVPVFVEKVVTRTVLVEKKTARTTKPRNDLTLRNSVQSNRYMTTANLTGFQPVSEFKAVISKKENQNENEK